jgi:hypothetical protein
MIRGKLGGVETDPSLPEIKSRNPDIFAGKKTYIVQSKCPINFRFLGMPRVKFNTF